MTRAEPGPGQEELQRQLGVVDADLPAGAEEEAGGDHQQAEDGEGALARPWQ